MKRCLLCDKTLNWQPTLWDLVSFKKIVPPQSCQACMNQFQRIGKQHRCRGCGRQRGELCSDCQQWSQTMGWLVHNQSLFKYNDAMKDYMHRYKFMGDYQLRQVFREELTQIIADQHADVIIPIPVHERTWQTRGFNQVIGMINCTYAANIIVTQKTIKNVPQSQKSRTDRLKMQQPFVIHNQGLICQKSVLLVDDVYTTGRTIYHAATLCRQTGCREIKSITLAS